MSFGRIPFSEFRAIDKPGRAMNSSRGRTTTNHDESSSSVPLCLEQAPREREGDRGSIGRGKGGDRETLLPAIKNKVGHSPRKVKYCLDGKKVSSTFGKCWIASALDKKEGERTLFSPWLSCPGQMIYRVVISRCRKLRLSGRPVMDGRRDGRRTDGRTDVGVRSEKEEEGASPKKRRSPRL